MEDNQQQQQLAEQEISSLNDNNSSMIKNNASAMGKQALKDAANIATKELKSKVKLLVTKYAASVAIIIAKILLIVILCSIVIGIIEWIKEKFEALEAPVMFKSALGINEENADEMLKQFVQIKKDDDGEGYHFEFVDDFNEKVEKAADFVGSKYGNLRDPELWKEFLMADFATQLPNLGGNGQVISSSNSSSSINGKGFWWPIGSSQTTTQNGKTFASGDPEIPHGTNVVEGGFSKGWCTTRHFKTTGEAMDIAGNHQIGHYNVISMAKGVVERADDGYSDNANLNDNGGMGNCVYVRYPGNILVRYMHLSKGTVAVKTGDVVDYGQVLGKMGHSGSSRQPHLHIDMWIGAENSTGGQDIASYFDATNPRPSNVSNDVSSLDGFLFIGDSITVGLKDYVKGNKVKVVGVENSTPKQWFNNEKSNNGEDTYSKLPEDSDDIKAICIMLGTNELSQTDYMQGLIRKLHEKYPNKPIFVQKILEQDNNDVSNYNSVIENFCLNEASEYATFIDATAGVKRRDGVHPTESGYKTLAKNIEKQIVSIKNNGDSSVTLIPDDEEPQIDEVTQDEEDFLLKAPKEFQGTIKIKRISPNKELGVIDTNAGIKSAELKYVEPETFIKYINNGDATALNVFTLSDDFSEIITATWSYEGGLKIEENSGMDYRNLTASYAMPYEYPMMFHVTGKDALFSNNLVKLVLGSSVDFVIIDNVVTEKTDVTTTVYEHNGESNGVTSQSTVTTYNEHVNSGVELGAVNSWWSKRTSEFDITYNFYQTPTTQQTIEATKDRTVSVTTQQNSANYSINSTNGEFESNHENFATIYNNSRAQANTQSNWLFQFMEENDRTANMVELTKYLLYKATGVNYGVTEFGDITLTLCENSVSGLYGGTIQEKIWWGLKELGYSDVSIAGALGNFEHESGFKSNNLEDEFEYSLGYTDESYTAAIDNGSYSLEQFISDHPKDNCGARIWYSSMDLEHKKRRFI